MRDCTLSGNVGSGLRASDNSTVLIRDVGTSTFSLNGIGLEAASGSQVASEAGLEFTSNMVGARASDNSTVSFSPGTSFSGNGDDMTVFRHSTIMGYDGAGSCMPDPHSICAP